MYNTGAHIIFVSLGGITNVQMPPHPPWMMSCSLFSQAFSLAGMKLLSHSGSHIPSSLYVDRDFQASILGPSHVVIGWEQGAC